MKLPKGSFPRSLDSRCRITLPKPFALYARTHGTEVLLLGHPNSFHVWGLVCFEDHLRRVHSWGAKDARALRDLKV